MSDITLGDVLLVLLAVGLIAAMIGFIILCIWVLYEIGNWLAHHANIITGMIQT